MKTAMPSQVAQLRDGTPILIRPVVAEDKALLLEGFAHFGPESRYYRFLAPKQRLSAADLRYLTEVDGVDHVALGAVRELADGSEQPLGIARFVRLVPGGSVAEPAVAVVDEMQGQGLGKVLLRCLAEAARERGITHFRSFVFADNRAMRSLFDELDPHAQVVRSHDGVAELLLSLVHPPDAERPSIETVLSHAAREHVEVRTSWTVGVPGGSPAEPGEDGSPELE